MTGGKRRAAALVLASIALVLPGLGQTAQAAEALTVSLYYTSPATTFSPNGDANEDRFYTRYCLSAAANVTARVTDGTGAVTAVLADDESGPAGCGGELWWDGRSTAGEVVPDAGYQLEIVGENASGSSSISLPIRVDTRVPGRLVSPVPGDQLSGTAAWEFVPTTGVDVTDVYLSVNCVGSYGTRGDDGAFRGTLDTGNCADGPATAYAAISHRDADGNVHSWSPPGVNVTLVNPGPPTQSLGWRSARTFSPNGDLQEDSSSFTLCAGDNDGDELTAVARVVVGDAVVRTLHDGVVPNLPSCGWWYGYSLQLGWDGLRDGGEPAPDGEYSLEVVVTDTTGEESSATYPITVDRRIPGVLVAPLEGDTLSGEVGWSFRTTDGFPSLSAVDLSAGCTYSSGGDADHDGTFDGTLDTTRCGDQAGALTPSASWVDQHGEWHGWSGPARPVVMANPASPVVSTTYSIGWFSPNGDGQDDQAAAAFCVSDTSGSTVTTSARIRAEDGSVVRDFGNEERGINACGSWYGNDRWLYWDGRDDTGAEVPDGDYAWEFTARDAGGLEDTVTSPVHVDRRVPGVLTSPAEGAVLTGEVPWTFTPTVGFPSIDQVAVTGCVSSAAVSAGEDGTFRGVFDSRACPDGADALAPTLSFIGPDQQWHGWTGPAINVIVDNGTGLDPSTPSVTLSPYSARVFSPNGDGQDDAVTVAGCQHDPDETEVGTRFEIRNGAGNVVRTFERGQQPANAEPCDSNWWYSYRDYLSWDGLDDNGQAVPDGDYVITYSATDPTDRTASSQLEVTVDRRVPGALTTPEAGGTLAGLARFVFTPTAGFDGLERVDLSFAGMSKSIYGPSSNGTWRTSQSVGGLPAGPTTLTSYAQWVDKNGDGHTHHRSIEVAVDPQAVPLQVALDGAGGQAPYDAAFTLTASDPNGAPLTVRAEYGDGTVEQHTLSSPYADLRLEHTYQAGGSYRAFFSVSNGAGGYAAQTVPVDVAGSPNAPPVVTVSTTPTSGAAPLVTETTLDATDADGDPLTWRIDFGDGSPVQTGSLPQVPVAHTYARPGRFVVRTEINDGHVGVVRWGHVDVVLGEPLAANAGDDQHVATGAAVTFDGGSSRPGGVISSYAWDFGDGQSGSGAQVTHAYSEPGTYTAKLTVRAGSEVATDTARVTVETPPPARGLAVTVTGDGAPLPGAEVTVIRPDGTRLTAVADGEGKALVTGVDDAGSVTAYVWADGFRPETVTGDLVNGRADVAVDLDSGAAGAVTVETHRMTYQEIVAAGVDVADPENSHVYEATINLFFVPEGDPAPEPDPDVPPITVIITEEGVTCVENCGGGAGGGGGGSGGGGGEIVVGDAIWEPSVQYVENKPVIQWLVLPMRASFLKEFFDVKMVVQNLTEGFTFEGGSAALTLPAGLALAPLRAPQSATVDVPSIPGGQSRSFNWVVRGDVEGDYDVTVDYRASVEPIGKPLHLQGRNGTPLKVWGASALRTTIRVDEHAVRWAPYGVDVEVQNVSDSPVYNFQVEMLDRPSDAPDTQAPFFYAPEPPQVQGTGVIAPDDHAAGGDDSWTARFVVYPGLGNDEVTELRAVLENSFIQRTGGDVDLAPTLAFRAESLGPASGTVSYRSLVSEPEAAHVFWSRAPGIEAADIAGYELWTRQSLTEGTWYKSRDLPNGSWDLDEMVRTVEEEEMTATIPASDRSVGRYVTLATRMRSGELRFSHRMAVGPPRYVSLGDSFSAGEGVPVFEVGTAEDVVEAEGGNTCHRSKGSYGRRLIDVKELAPRLLPAEFHACSGAITNDFDVPNPANAGEIEQPKHVNHFTDVVTMTLGGNDVGFGDVALQCLIGDCSVGVSADAVEGEIRGANVLFETLGHLSDIHSDIGEIYNAGIDCAKAAALRTLPEIFKCAWQAKKAKEAADDLTNPGRRTSPVYIGDNTLLRRLGSAYDKVATRAPNAQIFVAGYPQMITEGGGWLESCNIAYPIGGFGLSGFERAALVTMVGRLNTEIHKAVDAANARHGGRFTWVDPSAEFRGKELCSGATLNEGMGFNTIVAPILTGEKNQGPTSYSLHPNADGQLAYSRAFAEAIGRRVNVSVPTQPGKVTPAGSTFVPYGARTMRVQSSWPGSTVSLRLTNPAGEALPLDSQGVTSGGTETTQWVEITNPAPGEWKLAVYGDDVVEGEPAQVTAFVDDPAPPAPTAQISATEVADEPNRFTLSAAGSTGEGELSYLWMFSDGTTATGPTPTHTFGETTLRWAQLQVSDANGSDVVTTVLGAPANRAPVPDVALQTTAEDTPVEVPLRATDADHDPIAFSVEGSTAHGSATLVDTTVTYRPDPDFHGRDYLNVTADDGRGGVVPVVVPVDVTAVNDPPKAVVPATVTAVAGTPVSIPLAGTDVDGDALTYSLTAPPAHGTIVRDGDVARYTGTPGYEGADAFGFTVADGSATVTATVAIDVVPPPFGLAAPSVTAPARTFTATSSRAFEVAWGAGTAPASTRYTVEWRVAGTTAWQPWLSGVAHRSALFGGNDQPTRPAPGRTYEFRAVARDIYGRPTPASEVVASRLALDDRAGVVSAGWARVNQTSAWLGTTSSTSRSGASIQFEARGDGFALVGTRQPGGASFDVFVGGVLVGSGTADGVAAPRAVLFEKTYDARTARSVRIVRRAGGPLIVDGLDDRSRDVDAPADEKPFTSVPAVAIEGAAVVGGSLRLATALTFQPTPESVAYQWTRDGVAVGAASGTPQPYTLGAGDLGRTLRLVVTATRTGYDVAESTSNAVGPVTAGTFAVSSPAFAIAGQAKVGERLARSSWPTISPLPATTTWRWLADGAAVGTDVVAATPPAYVPTAADLGKSMRLRATIARPGYSSRVLTSNALGPVARGTFASLPTPVISGGAKVGAVLTLTTAQPSPAATSVTRKWLRDGVAISGATGASYTLVNADAGHRISVRIDFARAGYVTATRYSAIVNVAARNTLPPGITGTLRVGATLTRVAGRWFAPGHTIQRAWLRDGVPITGATGTTYVLRSADRGHTIRFRERAMRSGFPVVSAVSVGRYLR